MQKESIDQTLQKRTQRCFQTDLVGVDKGEGNLG